MNKASSFAALKCPCGLINYWPGCGQLAAILCKRQQHRALHIQRYSLGELFVWKCVLSASTWKLYDPSPGPEGQRNMTEAKHAESGLGCAQEQPLHLEWVPGRRQRREEEEALAQMQQASQQWYFNNTQGFVCIRVCVDIVYVCVLSGRW